jgi:hypothetical protein
MRQALVTQVRVTFGPAHDLVSVWNRGALAGELVVNRGDGERLARRLLADPEVFEEQLTIDGGERVAVIFVEACS